MGTWGTGNLQSDGALDVLAKVSDDLSKRVVALLSSPLAAEYDECAYADLFVQLEVFFALDRCHLLNVYPESEELSTLRDLYLKRFDAYMKKAGGDWPERREVIVKTLDHLIYLCEKEERRRADGPQWVEVTAPEMEELAPDLNFQTHLTFGIACIQIPNTWEVSQGEDVQPPEDSLLGMLPRKQQAGTFVLEKTELRLAQCFYATGPSLEPEIVPADKAPYVLLAKLEAVDEEPYLESYNLARKSADALARLFPNPGEHVSGLMVGKEVDSFDFTGVEAFRHVDLEDQENTLSRKWHLFYVLLDETTVLVMEYAAVEDIVDFHFPDDVLAEYISETLKSI